MLPSEQIHAGKMPCRNMVCEMGGDDEKPRDVNIQEIGLELRTPSPVTNRLGANFAHMVDKVRTFI